MKKKLLVTLCACGLLGVNAFAAVTSTVSGSTTFNERTFSYNMNFNPTIIAATSVYYDTRYEHNVFSYIGATEARISDPDVTNYKTTSQSQYFDEGDPIAGVTAACSTSAGYAFTTATSTHVLVQGSAVVRTLHY